MQDTYVFYMYVNMQHNYVRMWLIFVNMQDLSIKDNTLHNYHICALAYANCRQYLRIL